MVFCHVHQKEAWGGDRFWNRYGKFQFEPGWGVELRLLARWGSLFADGRLMPPDAREIRGFLMEALPPAPGVALSAPAVLRVFLWHLLKWPPCVAHFRRETGEAVTAEAFLSAFRRSVEVAKSWPRLFASMFSSPGPNFTSGAAHNAQRLGLIRPLPKPRAQSARPV